MLDDGNDAVGDGHVPSGAERGVDEIDTCHGGIVHAIADESRGSRKISSVTRDSEPHVQRSALDSFQSIGERVDELVGLCVDRVDEAP